MRYSLFVVEYDRRDFMEEGGSMAQEERKIFIVGHKNPDTDSICSAIAYSNLKNKIGHHVYEPRRAGAINEETQFVLNYFGIEAPLLIEDVRTQVRDIEIRKTEGVARNISLKQAWSLMKKQNVVTLAIVRRKRLEGLITIEDITKSYMEAYDSTILSTAHTQYSNIVETLEGTMLVGDMRAYYTKGKVLVAAANPDLMENYIEENDLVILGNRYESQLCAIEMNAGCIVVCEGAPVSKTIRKLAEERGCTVIQTPFDTFTAARLINQSMPISYFMRSEKLVTFNTEDYIDDIRDTMAKLRHRDFPILDKEGRYMGMISRRNLLGMQKKRVILVDHNERTQAVSGVESAEIMEIIDHHRLGTIQTMGPVFFRNQPVGCTATIIYQMYQESGVEISREIAGLLCSAIVSDTLLFRSPTCTVMDQMAAQALAAIAQIDLEPYAKEMFAAGSNLSSKTAEEIFYQDYKKFSIEDKKIGVGQISSMNAGELESIEEKLKPYMEQIYSRKDADMLFFLLTNIIEESSTILCVGSGAESLLDIAFRGTQTEGHCEIKGLVSRKKQFIPGLVTALQQDAV